MQRKVASRNSAIEKAVQQIKELMDKLKIRIASYGGDGLFPRMTEDERLVVRE